MAVKISRTDTFLSSLVQMELLLIPEFGSTSLNAYPKLELTSSSISQPGAKIPAVHASFG